MDFATRFELQDLYARYVTCLDQNRFDDWPEFFTEDAVYRVQPRENFERGLPLATMALEGRGMMKDRVYGVTKTLFFAPYYQRHIVGPLQVEEADDGQILVEANYLVLRTKRNEPTEAYNAGRYFDRVLRQGGRLLFAQKLCVFDSELIPNSLIYPI